MRLASARCPAGRRAADAHPALLHPLRELRGDRPPDGRSDRHGAQPAAPARSRLAGALEAASAAPATRAGVETTRREQWEDFNRTLHEHPAPRTYRDLYSQDVDVRDRGGRWVGVRNWSVHEREAIELGVRVTVVNLLSGKDVTVVGHCPPQATFVHRLERGRSRQLRIHYPSVGIR